MSCLPMFVEIKDRPCLVAGGGAVASRKVRVLQEFGADVTVVAREFDPSFRNLEGLKLREKSFELSDIGDSVLVIAATDDHKLNHEIARACYERGIPVNAVDQPEDCSFIFPAYLKQGEVVAAFSSGGSSPVVTQYLKEKTRPFMTERVGEMAACLKGLRSLVKESVPVMENRKKVYQEILEFGLGSEELPDEKEIQKIVDKYKDAKGSN